MFDLSYSLHVISEEEIRKQLNEISQRVILDDNTRLLVCIKNAKLHVLSHLQSIIAEICDCLILNCNQAAITLTNHLFENVIKQVLILWDSKGRCFSNEQLMENTFKEEINKYDDKDLEPNLNQCRNKKIITKEECKRLKDLKNKFRIPFSHASYTKLFADVKMPIWKVSLSKPNEVKEEMVNISMIPLLNTLAQVKFANTNAARYFLEIYALINDLDKKLLDLYPETKLFVKCQQNNQS